MPIENYFRKIVYSGGHDLSTLSVSDGRVDVAFVATHRFDEVINRVYGTLLTSACTWIRDVVDKRD